jgi:divalent metal cation (Fe/Co/Zn/Cd) transporter
MEVNGAEQGVADSAARAPLVRRGLRLEYLTVIWNSLEALLAIATGLLAGSIALVGFGCESVIEVVSGAALVWRLRGDAGAGGSERRESTALVLVGFCFLALALYVAFEAAEFLLMRRAPAVSYVGMVVAAASMVVMPLLARAKRRVAAGIGSRALTADSRQTSVCAYLSIIVLGGLLLNAWLGWWWSDPGAGLAMVPIIVKEGIECLRGERSVARPAPPR